MQNPATTADLIKLGYTPVPADSLVPQAWLDRAFRSLVLEVPSLEASITAGKFTAADVIDVVVAAALRALRNGDGVTDEARSLDDYSETFKRADATEDIYFTAAELRRLVPQVFGGGSFKYS